MVKLKNPRTNEVKEYSTGFSFLVFLFNIFVPLFRMEFAIAGKVILLIIVGGVVGSIFGFYEIGVTIFSLACGFLYSKWRIKGLVDKGFIPADPASKKWLDDNGIIVMGDVTFAEEAAPAENSDADKETKELCLSTAKEKANVKDDENTFVPPPPMK